jgi:hypothetical protein
MRKAEARDGARIPCEFTASIEPGAGGTPLQAVVRNISTFGARLEGVDVCAAPEHFHLLVIRECGVTERRRARRVWRSGEAMGVCFVDRATA